MPSDARRHEHEDQASRLPEIESWEPARPLDLEWVRAEATRRSRRLRRAQVATSVLVVAGCCSVVLTLAGTSTRERDDVANDVGTAATQTDPTPLTVTTEAPTAIASAGSGRVSQADCLASLVTISQGVSEYRLPVRQKTPATIGLSADQPTTITATGCASQMTLKGSGPALSDASELSGPGLSGLDSSAGHKLILRKGLGELRIQMPMCAGNQSDECRGGLLSSRLVIEVS